MSWCCSASSLCLGFLPSLPPQSLQDTGDIPLCPRAGIPLELQPLDQGVQGILPGWPSPCWATDALPKGRSSAGLWLGWHRDKQLSRWHWQGMGPSHPHFDLLITTQCQCPTQCDQSSQCWGTAMGTELSIHRCDTRD